MKRFFVLVAVLVMLAVPGSGVRAAQAEPGVSFTFANGTLPDDEALIRNGIRFAQAFFATEFGASIDGPIAVDARGTQQFDVIAHTAPGEIFIATGALGWHYSPALRKLQTVIHEYVHLFHWKGDPAGTMPLWLAEGSAEYLAWYAIDQLGLLDLETARDYWIGAMHANPALDGVPLASLESPDLTASGSVYEIGAYAVSRLVERAGIDALFAYFNHDADGDRAAEFESAFGTTVGAFYAEFESSRAAVFPLGFDLSRLAYPWYPAPDPADVLDAAAWGQVQPGGFALVQAQTSPGVSCLLTFIDPNGQSIYLQEMRANSDGSIFWLWQLDDLTVTGAGRADVTCGRNSVSTAIEIGGT